MLVLHCLPVAVLVLATMKSSSCLVGKTAIVVGSSSGKFGQNVKNSVNERVRTRVPDCSGFGVEGLQSDSCEGWRFAPK